MYIPLYIVNDKSEYVVINDDWTSLQLQQFISDKFNIAVDDQIVYFQGKPLFGKVIGTLKQNGVSKGDNIFISKKLNGGKTSSVSISMTIMTIILFILFCTIMIIGIVPVWAHVFGCYIKKGICWLFGSTINSGGFTGMILKYIMYAISFLIVGIFVYSLTGIAFFILLFNKKQHFCSSVIIARYIALTLTTIFIVIYALFALPDFAGQIGLKAQNKSPIFVGAILTPILNTIEWVADTGKFALFYLIPILGELMLAEQDMISYAVEYLYIFFNEMKDIGCNNDQFDIALIGMLEYFETTIGCTFVQEHNLKRVVELIFYTFEDKIRKITNNGKWGLAQIIENKNNFSASQHAMATNLHNKIQNLKSCQTDDMKKQIDEFKKMEGCLAGKLQGISSMILNSKKLYKGTSAKKAFNKSDQSNGAEDNCPNTVNICKVYSTLLCHSKKKWNNYDYNMNMWKEGTDKIKKEYEEKNPMPLDPITKASLPLSENIICSIFQIFPAINNILNNCIGRPYVMVNMIENSQIAGVLTTIATIVIIILTYVLSSMYGYKI